MNVSLEGKSYPDASFTIDHDRVERFRSAVGGPPFGVPPTFVTAGEFTSFPAVVNDPELDLDFSRVVHSEQEYRWRRPLRVGETVTVRTRIAQAREKGGHGFLTIEAELVAGDGIVVATAYATMLERGGS